MPVVHAGVPMALPPELSQRVLFVDRTASTRASGRAKQKPGSSGSGLGDECLVVYNEHSSCKTANGLMNGFWPGRASTIADRAMCGARGC